MGVKVNRTMTLLGRGKDLDQKEELKISYGLSNDDEFKLTATDSTGDSVTISLSRDELREAGEEILKVVGSGRQAGDDKA